ncbi:MAG: helix-turn-helix domain-containing protein, partial [Bacteroidota bacterium]|nr:helix-turn-helix domain-containing protein [Bacteroidota bacterium]
VNTLLREGDMGQIHSEITEKEYDFEQTIDETIIKSNTDDIENFGSEINYEKTQIEDTEEVVEENLSLEDMEKKLIIKALSKYKSKRKLAADDLGISERTLYRKIKQYDIDL